MKFIKLFLKSHCNSKNNNNPQVNITVIDQSVLSSQQIMSTAGLRLLIVNVIEAKEIIPSSKQGNK